MGYTVCSFFLCFLLYFSEAIRDPDLSLEQIKRMMRTIFINHSERLSVTKNNPEYNRYQGSNRRGRETGRESAMSTAFITCHYCKKAGHKVRECKQLERNCEMEKSRNHEREKKWCSYHQRSSHSDKQCYHQMGKTEKIKNGRQKKWCSLHNSTNHSNKNVSSREVGVTVRTVMVELAEKMKPSM